MELTYLDVPGKSASRGLTPILIWSRNTEPGLLGCRTLSTPLLKIKILRTLCDPLPLFVSIRFQVYFTALTGLLFTFPSRY